MRKNIDDYHCMTDPEKRALKMHWDGMSVVSIAAEMKVTRQQVYQYVKQAKLTLERTPEPLRYLNKRAANVLVRLGITNRRTCKSKINKGELIPGKVSNYGRMLHQQVCDWCGADVKNEKRAYDCIRYLEKKGYTVVHS